MPLLLGFIAARVATHLPDPSYGVLKLADIVASIYRPFSVNTFGSARDFELMFAVKNFDRKVANSSEESSTTYPCGNFSGLFLTA